MLVTDMSGAHLLNSNSSCARNVSTRVSDYFIVTPFNSGLNARLTATANADTCVKASNT